MTVRDGVIAAAVRIGLPPLELRSELARDCADGRISEELVLAHSELVEFLVLGPVDPRERLNPAPLPRGATKDMICPPDTTGITVIDWLMVSIQGIQALAAEGGIHLRHGRVTPIYTHAMTKMTHGIPTELVDRMHEFLAHLAHAADHPSSEVGESVPLRDPS